MKPYPPLVFWLRVVRRWWLLAVLFTLLVMFFTCLYSKFSWRDLPREGATRKWQRGQVLHIDENGDGRVEEEIVENPKTDQRTVRRDTNRDGWFDVKYNLGPWGIAMNPVKIHERAPRH